MPRKSQHKSPVAPNDRSQSQGNLDDYFNSSQASTDIHEEAIKVVRYFLFKSPQNNNIKKQDLQKNIIPNVGRQFNLIMSEANKILENVYGLKLSSFDTALKSGKYYFLNNNLQPLENNNETIDVTDKKNLLLLLILSHLFMSITPITENSIYNFLGNLQIDLDDNRHKDFDDIEGSIEFFVEQRYLKKTNDNNSEHVLVSWGPRAEASISKMEVLGFVSQFYGVPASAWREHYKIAQNQDLARNIL